MSAKSPKENAEKKLEDGIYVVKPGEEWLVVNKGKEQTFKAPDYDLNYLLRAYQNRIPFRGESEGHKVPTIPTQRQLTEHLPEEIRDAARKLGLGGNPADFTPEWLKEHFGDINKILGKIKHN